MNGKNTAVITYVDEFCVENLEKDFLESLFKKAQYKGKVIILDYGMNIEETKRIKEKFDVEVLKCKKLMPVFSNRYYDIPRAIDMLEDNITHIMTIDGGDVWFQEKIDYIFSESYNGIGCVEEERIIGEDDFTEYCLKILTNDERKKIEDKLLGKKVKNSGMICGPRNLVRQVIVDILDDMKKNTTEYFGIDQLFFNYEWYSINENRRVVLNDRCNFVLVSNVNKFSIRDEMIYDSENKLVTVVHNAGANWRVLKRPFENKSLNEEQYTDIRKPVL